MHDEPYLPLPIAWHEGMPLHQQHFQQQERYWQAMLSAYHALLQEHAWGWLKLQTHTQTGRQGYVELMAAEAIDNTGKWRYYHHTVCPPCRLALTQPGLLYVQWQTQHNATDLTGYTPSTTQATAYRVCYRTVPDQYDTKRCNEIACAAPRWQLAFHPDKDAPYMAIAEIEATETGFAPNPAYLPPSLTLPHQHPLYREVIQIMAIIKTQCLYRLSAQSERPDPETDRLRYPLMELHSKLHHYLKQQKTHPYRIYRAIQHTNLILQHLFPEPQKNNPGYQHDNSTTSIRLSWKQCEKKIHGIFQQHDHRIPLNKIRQNLYQFEIQQHTENNKTYRLTLYHPQPYPDWKLHREKQIKINYADALEHNVSHATTGIPLRPTECEDPHLLQLDILLANNTNAKRTNAQRYALYLPEALQACIVSLQSWSKAA